MTFSFTCSYQEFVVPMNVSCIRIEAYGASGGGSFNSGSWGIGGLGGYISTIIGVIPLQKLFLFVGGQGASRHSDNSISHTTGGFNVGGPLCGPGAGEGG